MLLYERNTHGSFQLTKIEKGRKLCHTFNSAFSYLQYGIIGKLAETQEKIEIRQDIQEPDCSKERGSFTFIRNLIIKANIPD